MKQITFTGGSRPTYECPETRTITINLNRCILDTSVTGSSIQQLSNGDAGDYSWEDID